MLKKSLRLGKKDLAAIFKARTRYFKGKLITARAVFNGKKITRFAFVVSGPKHRAAALRNLARRRMSAAAEEKKNTPPGIDVVLFLKLGGRSVPSFKEIKSDINYVLDKIIF